MLLQKGNLSSVLAQISSEEKLVLEVSPPDHEVA